MASRGPGGAACKLDDAQLDRLADELDRGPAAQEWADWTADQRWTLGPVAALIHRLFGADYTLRGAVDLLHQIGWTPQVPAGWRYSPDPTQPTPDPDLDRPRVPQRAQQAAAHAAPPAPARHAEDP